MLKDGKYSVWMRTPLAEGMGVVMLAPDGKLCGRDTIMSYTGQWRAEGDEFEANVSAVRHSTGPGAFGALDKIDVTVTGLARGGVSASCKGTAKQAPGLKLEATLVRMADGLISPQSNEIAPRARNRLLISPCRAGQMVGSASIEVVRHDPAMTRSGSSP